jgi:hypothetical protein
MAYKEIRQSAIPFLSFMKNTDCVMYVGPDLDLMQLCKLRVSAGSSLIYLPELLRDISKDAFEYNFPGVAWPGNLSAEKIYDRIRAELAGGTELAGMLILRFEGDTLAVFDAKDDFAVLISYVINKCRRPSYEESDIRFSVRPDGPGIFRKYSLSGYDEHPFDCLSDTLEDIPIFGKEAPRYESCCEELGEVPVDTAEISFDEQMEEAADEVREAIKRLLLKGFSASVIRSWLEEDVKLSRLRITRRFKILLVDYDKEVKMGPLPKTVFLFFLRHPEGVMFSHLMDHTDELLHIYSQVCRNDDPEKMHESVGRLTDPFDNSINEKCAAVKKAFMMQIEDSIARNYYICGQQGFKKGISLDRSLVEWECEL